ncbi:hypothetical protein BKA70DRAFT_1214459 [Coprinopsis sp. MPI-PUGE-AT-0042]|nr:hypothetical protein BKA70DRAFT_1214459 [Coprinopsis sp. MPI-PUGE-AT-0042]
MHDITAHVKLHHYRATIKIIQPEPPTPPCSLLSSPFTVADTWQYLLRSVSQCTPHFLRSPTPISGRLFVVDRSSSDYTEAEEVLGYHLSTTQSMDSDKTRFHEPFIYETWQLVRQLPNGVALSTGMDIQIWAPRAGYWRSIEGQEPIVREGKLTAIIGWSRGFICYQLLLAGIPGTEGHSCDLAVIAPVESVALSLAESCYYYCNFWRMERPSCIFGDENVATITRQGIAPVDDIEMGSIH